MLGGSCDQEADAEVVFGDQTGRFGEYGPGDVMVDELRRALCILLMRSMTLGRITLVSPWWELCNELCRLSSFILRISSPISLPPALSSSALRSNLRTFSTKPACSACRSGVGCRKRTEPAAETRRVGSAWPMLRRHQVGEGYERAARGSNMQVAGFVIFNSLDIESQINRGVVEETRARRNLVAITAPKTPTC